MFYGNLKYLELGKITASGWLKEQLQRSKAGMGGNLDYLEPNMMWDPYIKKSSISAWKAEAAGWGAEISGNYWFGLIALAFTLDDPELKEKAEKWVEKVLQTQEEDGYLGTYGKNDDRSEDYNAWGNACGLRALLLYSEATRREDIFNAVVRALKWFVHTDEWSFTSYAGAFILRLMSYCVIRTEDEELKDFCQRYEQFLEKEENDTFRIGINALLDDNLYYNQHHTAGFASQVARPAAVYLCDGDKRKLKASIKGFEKIHHKCLLVNGGLSGNAEWLSPKGATAETEYCTSTFVASSYAIMAAATGQAVWGDHIERVLFNVAQGARKKDERAIAYFVAPNQLCATDHSSHVHDPHGMYAPVHRTACCPVNSVIIIPEFVKNMAMTDGDDLYILCYGPCVIDHKGTKLSFDTVYPFRQNISVTVQGDMNFSLYLKKPCWCGKMLINGKEYCSDDRGFVRVDKTVLRDGKIEIYTEMTAEVVETDDTDGADKHPLSVVYGPLCFALPVEEVWTDKGNGYANKPLPEGWCWFEVEKNVKTQRLNSSITRLDDHKWNFATTKEKLEKSIKVNETAISGFLWENPCINITVEGWHAPYLFNHYTPRTHELYGKKTPVSFEKEVTLVPFGCTNLRITCFPIAEV